MLSGNEKKVMTAVYKMCSRKNPLLVSHKDLKSVANLTNIKSEEIEKIIENLANDGYFDLIFTERHGETIFCITLLKKGKAYQRRIKEFRRNLVFRIVLSAGLAVMSFIIGLILKAIF